MNPASKNCIQIIGIDTGKHTGFAIWHRQQKALTEVSTLAIHDVLFRLKELKESGAAIFVRVEDARLRKWFGKDKKKIEQKQQGAGSVKRDATIMEAFLIAYSIPYECVNPLANSTKLDADRFKMYTGHAAPTTNHARDAAMLVYKY